MFSESLQIPWSFKDTNLVHKNTLSICCSSCSPSLSNRRTRCGPTGQRVCLPRRTSATIFSSCPATNWNCDTRRGIPSRKAQRHPEVTQFGGDAEWRAEPQRFVFFLSSLRGSHLVSQPPLDPQLIAPQVS